MELSPAPRVRVGETEGLIEALKLGQGLCQVPDFLVQRDVAAALEALRERRPSRTRR